MGKFSTPGALLFQRGSFLISPVLPTASGFTAPSGVGRMGAEVEGGSTSAHAPPSFALPPRGSHRGQGLLPAGRSGIRRPRRASPPGPLHPAWPACRSTSARPSAAQIPSAPPWLSHPNGENGEVSWVPLLPPLSQPQGHSLRAPPRTQTPAHRPAQSGEGDTPPPSLSLDSAALTPSTDSDSAAAPGCSSHTLSMRPLTLGSVKGRMLSVRRCCR